MTPPRPVRPAPLVGALAVLSLIACTGCVPNLTWLPDSSGFIYSGPDGRKLIHYDLATRKQQVIVADTKTKTVWPAVSPDGKRVAAAQLVTNKDMPDNLQVIIYDRAGQEVQRSTPFRWNEPSGGENGNLGETCLFWSPRGEHIIVLAGENTGLYDVRNDGMVILDSSYPFVVGGTPVRPDGEGFLVSTKVGEGGLRYSFVNWEGREYGIGMKPGPVGEEPDWMRFPVMYNTCWEGKTAVIRHASACLRLDTGKYQGSLEGAVRPEPTVEVRQQAVFENRTVLRVRSVNLPDGSNEREHYRVEYLSGPEVQPRVLVERTDYCFIIPAPNRRLAAVRCNPSSKGDVTLVIDERGEVMAEAAMTR